MQVFTKKFKSLQTLSALITAAAITLTSTAAIKIVSTTAYADGALLAMNPTNAIDAALIQALALKALQCAYQPYAVKRNGNKSYGQVRSHCSEVVIQENRAEFNLEGRHFTLITQENENSDGGDLNDLLIQFDAQKDTEVVVQKNLLAFSDPIVALLLAAGHAPEELPEVLDEAVLR